MANIVGDGELWRRMRIDGGVMAMLKESPGLIKYSFDLDDEDLNTLIVDWL